MTKKHALEDLQLIPGSKPNELTVRLSPEISIQMWAEPKCGPKLYYGMLESLLRWGAKMNICPNCGLILPPDKTYCLRCGHKME
ncbi:MAG: hypothetical protein Q4Q20_02425 [Methanocorpusculum sp.]|nr:hypothetical protein [Methanocorpusculum sp.]